MAQRRDVIVEAAAGLLREGGPTALTHRAVATAAGVPLAATTYYFASKEELLAEGLAAAAGAEVARLTELAGVLDEALAAGGDAPEIISQLLAGALAAEYASVATKFEVYLAAHRRPALRPACERWIGAFRALAERAMSRAGAADPQRAGSLLVAAVDGLLLRRLATGEEPLDTRALAAELCELVMSLTHR
jgi:DNA-binding transcriptional regulator YbjK